MKQQSRPCCSVLLARGSGKHIRVIGALLGVVLLGTASLGAAPKNPVTAKEQLVFGVEMAQRGLWSEALFRFRQAQRLEPENALVLNNLAVAHEALGLFEEALGFYRQGLKLAPQDKGLRANYARFLDFYQRFKPEDEEQPAQPASSGDASEPKPNDLPPGIAATSHGLAHLFTTPEKSMSASSPAWGALSAGPRVFQGVPRVSQGTTTR